MSAPATKAFSPPPVRITTRVSLSAARSVNTSSSSPMVAMLSALRTLGRSMVTYAILFFFSSFTFSKCMEIQQRERSHRIAAAELHGVIDVGNRANAFFVSADGVQKIRDQQPVDDKARLVTGANRDFAKALAEVICSVKGSVAGRDRTH